MTILASKDILKYLDATAGLHGGHGSKEFVELIKKLSRPQDGFTRVTKKAIAEHFGNVDRHTIDNWINYYNEQHEKFGQSHD